MKLVKWDPAFETGDATVDHQHQRLFELINDLHEAVRDKRGDQLVRRTLDELAWYTAEHFAAEEALMDRFEYPAAPRHRKIHGDLLDRLEAVRADHAAGAPVTMRLYSFLMDWLKEHIRREDKALVGFVQRRRPAVPA